MLNRSPRLERFATIAVAVILLAGTAGLVALFGGARDAGTPDASGTDDPFAVATASATPEESPSSTPTTQATQEPSATADMTLEPTSPSSEPTGAPETETPTAMPSVAEPSPEETPPPATPRPQVTPVIAAAYGSFGDTLVIDEVSVRLDQHAPSIYAATLCEGERYVQEGRTELVSYEMVMTWSGDVVMPPRVVVGSVNDLDLFEEPNEQFFFSGLTYLVSGCKRPSDPYGAVVTFGPLVNPVPSFFWEFHFS